ncbi:MAG: PAS domain-containing protein [Balneolaceae bacterium]
MKFTPLRIALFYFIFAITWILFTDQVLAFFAKDVQTLSLFQTWKGVFYISFTAGILYLMVHSYENYIKREQYEKEEKERSFRLALNSVQMATWEYFVKTDSYLASSNHNKFFGIDKDVDITLDHIFNTIYDEDVARFKKAVDKSLTEHTDFNIEYRVKLPDGTIRWLWTKGLVYDAGESTEKVSGVTIDITDKKELEERLELEKEKLEKLFGRIPVLITVYDPMLDIAAVNREFENVLGWTKEDLKKHDLMDLCYPNPIYRKRVKKFMAKPDSGWEEFEVISKDGKKHYQLWTNISLADDTSVGIGHDITEQKLKEQDLREKEYLLSESQRVAHLGTYIIKPATGEEKPSKILNKIFGAPEGENITLEKWKKSVHPDFRYIIKDFNNAVKNGQSFVQEYKLIRDLDGETRWIFEKAEHILNKAGHSEAMIGTVQDITERKKQEKLFQRQRDQLLTAQEIAKLGYWVLNLETWLFEWSDMTFKLFGREMRAGEPGYKEFLQKIVHPDDKQMVESSFKRCLSKGSEEVIYRALKPNGEIIFIQGNAELVHDKEGNKNTIRGTILDITMLKKIENELKEEQKRFEIAADISSDVVWEWKIDEEELWWGEGIETVFGYKKKDYLGVSEFWQSKIHPEDKDRVMKSMEEAENSEALEWNDEYRFLAADGSVKQVKDSAVIRRNNEGKVNRIIGAMVDVTTIAQYQQTLQRERQRFEMIAKSSNDVLYEWNMHTNEIWWSEGWQTNFGFSEDEIECNFDWWENRLHPDDKERVNKSIKLADTKGKVSWNEQYRFLNAKNEYSVLMDKAFFIKGSDGSNKFLVGTISDITVQVNAEEKLKSSEEQYRLLFEQSSIPMWIFDKETLYFITANNAAIEKYGYSKEELTKMKIFDLHLKNDLEKLKKEVRENLKVSKTGFDAWTHKTKSGEELIVEISGSDILYLGKTRRLIIANDITEQRKAEKRAISAIIEGEERERQRISKELHDGLGQYLSAANMNLETVYEDMPELVDPLKDSFKNGLEFLQRAISETRTISQNLLPKAIQDYGLELAIESLVNQLRNTNKEIQFYLYRNLDGVEIPAKIQINLYRIAQEALSNAIRHGNPNNIDVQLVYSENEILMSIEDNGSGFEFDTVNGSGNGIGLRSIRTRVGAMSANLDIVSTPGRGTIISVVIPL